MAFAQSPAAAPPAVPVLHAEARVVQIDVVVTDSQGKPVGDLTKQDFTITDEGKPRAIDIFTVNRGEPVPRAKPTSSAVSSLAPNVFSNRNAGPPDLPGHSTVIVLDQDSYNPAPGQRNTFEDAAYAQQQTIELMSKVKPDEQIALYVMARKEGLVVLQDYTKNRDLLLKSLRSYIPLAMSTPAETHPDKPTSIPGSKRRDPNEVPQRETESLRVEETREVRLSFQALAEHLALVPGRKNVFWVTEGFKPFRLQGMEKFAWDKTITALNEANVAVNAVDSVALTPQAGGRPPNALEEIAGRTGGQAWLIRNDLSQAMAEGIEASRTTYTLGFYLNNDERDDKFHTLKVQADRRGLELYYRQGYYAGNVELPESSRDKGELESALLNQIDSAGVGITARIEATGSAVKIHLNLDPATLSLKEQGTGWTGKVEETFVEQDVTGNTLTKVSDTKEFGVTAANRARYDSEGVAWPISMPLAQGATRVRIVVRDSKTGHVGSLTIPLPQ